MVVMNPIDLHDALLTGIDSSEHPSASWRSVFEKVAAMMSERWGIQVIMRGSEAHTDGRRIVLPVVPENAPAELLAAVHGTLDHEAGHVIFSEFFAIPDPLEKHLVNALEDAREEERLIAIWPGCAKNLRACNEFFCRRLDEAGWPVSVFHKFCIALYFSERSMSDHWFATRWIDTCTEIAPHVRAAREILAHEPVHGCASTRDVLTLARKILAAVRSLADAKAPPPPAPASAPDEAEADSDAHDPSESEKPSPKDGGVDAADSPEPEEAGTGGPDSGDVGAPEDRAPASAGPSDGASARSGEAEAAPEPAPEPAPEGPTERCDDITDVAPTDLQRDAEWTVQRFLSEKAREALAAADGAYLAFTTEHDVVETAPDGDRAAYQRMIQSVRGEVSVIKRTLARTLLATRRTRWERGLPRGKVNPAALHKIPVGVDQRVFRRRESAPALNTRVSLLVDHSGSMIGSRIVLAARAAAVFAEVLAQLRIPFEVLGFTSGAHIDGQQRFHAAKAEDRELFARWGALRTIVYKDFAEDFRRVSGRLDTMARFRAGEANYDSESVGIAARRLAESSRPGERRILFVFSDGCPAGTVTCAPLWARQVAHLHEVIREITRSGTELFGIGIESDSVRTYYQQHVIVNSADALPREALRALDKLLRQGLRRP